MAGSMMKRSAPCPSPSPACASAPKSRMTQYMTPMTSDMKKNSRPMGRPMKSRRFSTSAFGLICSRWNDTYFSCWWK